MKLIVDDNIIVRGELCAAGSKMLYNFRPPFQADAVDRAIAAGWQIVGRADIGEFAMDGSGYTCFRGPVANPLDASCCGSGAAAAVRQGEAEAALIVDCGGDGLRLAAFSGCAAFRPTYGRVSRFGVIANVSSSEQISGCGATVEMAAALVGDVAGHDEKDATSLPATSYDFTVPASVEGLKVGLLGALPEAAAMLKAAGAQVEQVEAAEMNWLELGGAAYAVMAAAEGCNNISRFDGVKYGFRAEKFRNMEELYVNSRSQGFGPEAKIQAILGTYFLSKGRYEEYYYKALQIRRKIREQYTALFSRFDGLLSWAGEGVAYPLAENPAALVRKDRKLTAAAAIAGLPGVALPWWEGPGLPRALQVTADSDRDRNALAIAAALEGGEQ